MRALARIMLAIAMVGSLAACQFRPKSIILIRETSGVVIAQDLCGLGVSSVVAYPSNKTGVLTDDDALWGLRARPGTQLANRIELFARLDGYDNVGSAAWLPDGSSFAVHVDNSSQFFKVESLPSGRFAWDGSDYEISEIGRVAKTMEERDPTLRGKCE